MYTNFAIIKVTACYNHHGVLSNRFTVKLLICANNELFTRGLVLIVLQLLRFYKQLFGKSSLREHFEHQPQGSYYLRDRQNNAEVKSCKKQLCFASPYKEQRVCMSVMKNAQFLRKKYLLYVLKL